MFRNALNRAVKVQNVRTMATTSLATKATIGVEKFKAFLQAESTRKAAKAAMIELRPPSPVEIPIAIRDGVRLFTRGNWRNLTFREAWLNTLVTTEVVCWFFIGEAIAKGSLIGYQV